MIRDLLILPDGSELFSGAQEKVAIKSLSYTRQVSGNGALDFRCAAASVITVQLLDETESFSLEMDTALKYYRVDEKGSRLLMGTFYVQKVTRPGKHTMEFDAYDAMIWAEQDVTQWLSKQTWPRTMRSLLNAVCQICGIPTQTWTMCNGSQQVEQFYQQITGRQLISYIAEANVTFAYISPEGKLELQTMTTADTPITARDVKSYQCAQTPCAPIDSVAIHQEEGVMGEQWPSGGVQAYRITANPVLPNHSQSMLKSCMIRLYNIIKGISYSPLEAEVFVDSLSVPWQPGQLVQVQIGDRSYTCAVFSIRLEGNVAHLKSWGEPYRDSAVSQHSRDTVKILQKQMTKLSLDMEGISTEVTRVEAEFADQVVEVNEDISSMQVVSDKIFAQVSQVETAMQVDLDLVQKSVQTLKKQVDLSVTAQQLELSMASMAENGVQKVQTKTGYTFDQEGLSIADSRSDVHNLINYNGMYVSRGTDVILQADADGVIARDVKVHNYLVVGDHARLEDYQINRTACFWL